jgi:hypothetical protein
LGDIWVIGENGKFDEAIVFVRAQEATAVQTWTELLQLAMLYHQVRKE